MPIRQGRKVTELTALNSASLNTYVVGVDNNVTYKISLDVLEDAVVKIVSSSTDARLDAIEAYTASFSASTNISSLNSFTSSANDRINNLEQATSSFYTEDDTYPQDINFVARFTETKKLGKAPIFISGSTVIIGGQTSSNHPQSPEGLAVYSPLDSYNLISGHGNINSYLQINVKNFSNLTNASTDVVATANNGTENSYYVNMGINGSGYDEDTIIGTANDTYVYGYGNVFHMGNASTYPVYIFAGGFDARGENLKMVIDPNNNHSLTGSLNISGSLTVIGNQYISGAIEFYNTSNISNTTIIVQQDSDGTLSVSNGKFVPADGIRIPGGQVQMILKNDASSEYDAYIENVNGVGLKISSSGAIDSIMELSGYSLNIGNTLTASISEGYIWVGGETNKTYEIPTSSFERKGSGIISSSTQLPSGIISGSSQLTSSYDTRYTLSGSISSVPSGTISGSSQLTSSYDLRYALSGTIQIPTNGLISSSAQITDFGFISSSTDITSLNTFTASYYIDSASLFDSIQNLENSTSSYETTGRGILSGSVSYTELTNIPLGIVSGSSQLYSDFSQLNSNNTFIGDQTITGNLNVSNGISASSITVQTFYAVSSSVASTSGSTSFGSTNSDFMNVTGSLNVTNAISASTFVGLGNLNIYSSSIENKFISDRLRLNSLELSTSSYETRGRGIVSSSSQIISILTPLNTYTGSNDTKWTTIQNITSSLISVTASYETRGRGIISGSSQLTSSYDLRYTLSGSVQPLPSGLISGSSQLTASYDLRYAQIGSGGTIPTGTISGSSQLTASYDGRYVQTGSFNTLTASFNSFTASAQTITTGSNSFNGTQIITGSLIVTTGSFVGSVITANTSSLYLTSGSNLYVQNNAVVEITGSLLVSGSTNLIVSNLQIGTGSGNEGGELLLAKAATNTSITGSGVVIDIFQNRLRFFEQGGNSRGGYLDITTLGNSVGTNLSNLTYLLEAYASVTYSLPGSYSNDTCRYSVVNTNINVSSSWFDTSSYTFTPQKAGYWEIIAGYDVYRGSSAEASLFIQKNNSTVAIAGGIGTVSSIVTKIVYLNGSTDNIKIVNNGASINSRSQSSDKSFFQAKFVGE